MNFYKCPQCKGTDFYFTHYPDIWCRHCRSIEVVQAMSYTDIDNVLTQMDQEMQNQVFGYSSKDNIRSVKSAQPSLKPIPIVTNQYNQHTVKDIGEGRGISRAEANKRSKLKGKYYDGF